MSADNEFTAMQSVGISPLPAICPAIVMTTLLSIATVALINVAFTWGFHGIQRVVLSSVENIAYCVLEREHSFQTGSLSLTVQGVEGRNLVKPVIKIDRDGGESITINSATAVLQYDDASECIALTMTDGHAKFGTQAAFYFPDTYRHNIPLGVTPSVDPLTAHPSHMQMRDLPSASVQQQQDIHRRQGSIAAHFAFDLLTSRPKNLVNETAQARQASLASSRQRLHRLDTEMHRRWASGFTCLAMSMIGIPFAIWMKASDTMTTFGIVFLPTVLIYYPVFALTLDLAKDGRIAPQGVWIANGLFIMVSVVMMRQLVYKAS